MAFAAALLSGVGALPASEVWIGPSGNWSENNRWLDGSAPMAGGDAAQVLSFAPLNQFAQSAVNDLGAFSLNKLLFDSTGSFTVSSTIGGRFELTGPSPAIEMRRGGDVVITSPLGLTNIALGDSAHLRGEGLGNLTITGPISGDSGLTVAGTAPHSNAQIFRLNGVNTFTGGVVLKSGNLTLGDSAALGSGALTVEGGTLRVESPGSVANAIVLKSDLLLAGTMATGLSGVISSANAGTGLTWSSNGATLSLTAPSTYSGATTIDFSLTPGANLAAGTIRLTGNGSLLNSSAIHVRAGGTLQMDALHETSNRIGDNTPVHLRSGTLLYMNPSGAIGQTETVGALTTGGYSTVTITASNGGSTRLTVDSLSRSERGTFLFRGSSLGGAFGPSTANLLIKTPPTNLVGGGGTGANTSILPYAIGDASSIGNGSSFVTYDSATGIRPLNTSTEYTSALSSATSTNNVRLMANASLTSSRTINSLVLTGGSISGSSPLTIASGAILSTAHSSISSSLPFGSVEANIFSVGALTLGGTVSGNNGLTKSGLGILTLSGNNTSLTGPLTVNAGHVHFSTANNLGSAASPIVLGGTEAGLTYTSPTGSVTLTRDIHLVTGIPTVAVAGLTGQLTLQGNISGTAGLRLTGSQPFAGEPKITLQGTNTYTGPTLVMGALNLVIASDAALGNGGTLELNTTGKLILGANWQTNRPISLGGITSGVLSRIDTAGYNAVLNGHLTGMTGLTKLGTGTLQLGAENRYSGSIVVQEGKLELGSSGAVRTASWTLNPGTNLVLNNTDSAKSGRMSSFANITAEGATLSILGNAGTSVSESINSLSLKGTNTINLSSPGSADTTFNLSSLNLRSHASTRPTLLLNGNNLGGAAGSGSTRVVPAAFQLPQGAPEGFDFIPGVYISDPVTGAPTTFVINDTSVDAAGPVGLRALRPAEYITGTIRNPSNGGATPTSAHVLIDPGTTTVGAANTVATLTVNPGGILSLDPNETLTVATGSIFVRSGSTVGRITGGTLDIGQYTGQVYTAGDLLIESVLSGSGTLSKVGPGVLTIGRGSLHAATEIHEGTIRLAPSGSFSGAVAVSSGATLDVAGISASAGALNGNGSVTLGSGTLTIGTLDGDMTFGGVISGTGKLVITGGTNGSNLRTLSGENTFSGGVTLNSGRLALSGNTPLGSGTLTVNGGALYTATARTITNPVVVDGTLGVEGKAVLTLQSRSGLSGVGTIEVRGNGGVVLRSASSHSGETRSVFGLSESITSPVGPITLSGATGSATASSAFRIAPSGLLHLDNTTALDAGGTGRIGDNAPIELKSAQLKLTGNATAGTLESVGPITGTGYSTITVVPGTTTTAGLSGSSLSRVNGGTFLFRAPGLGSGAATNAGAIHFTSAPAGLVGGGGTGSNTSILPYAIGDSSAAGTGSGFVTVDPATGIRLLTSAEYAASLTGASASSNVRLQGTVNTASDVTVNALAVSGFTTVGGTGKIAITSGALLKSGPVSVSIANPIDFGTAEANIFVVSDPNGGNDKLSLTGVISGTGGLTKSGAGEVLLSGANTLTGPITINAGVLSFEAPTSLGSGTSPIVVNGDHTAPGLRYLGNETATLARDLQVNSGFLGLSTEGILNFTGSISGNGGVSITGYTSASQYIVFNGPNSYSGPTVIHAGLAISSDASLGTNSRVVLAHNGGTDTGLRLNAPWTTERNIEISGFSSELDTNGFDARWNGTMTTGVAIGTNNIGFVKSGAGTLTIPKTNTYDGRLTVAGGTLRLSEQGQLQSREITISDSGWLHLDNAEVGISNRLPGNPAVKLLGGNLKISGNANEPVTESFGRLTNSSNFSGKVVVTAPGTAMSKVSFVGLDSFGSRTTFLGDNLGGSSGGGGTRITFSTFTQLVNGLLPHALADITASGGDESFATYDSSTDEAGPIGVRPLRISEYATGSTLQTTANGGTTPTTANYLVDGPTTVTGATTALNSLTFTGSGRLTLGAEQFLALNNSAGMLARKNASATLAGGIIDVGQTGSLTRLYFQGSGDLTLKEASFRSTTGTGELVKLGTGTLTLENTTVSMPFVIEEGVVRLASGNSSLSATGLTVGAGGEFQLGGTSAEVSSLEGSGKVSLGNGTLTLRNRSDFSGSITGSGGLRQRDGTGTIIRSAATYTGPTEVGRNPSALYISPTFSSSGPYLSFFDNGSALNSSEFIVSGGASLSLSNMGPTGNRIGNVPIRLNSGTVSYSTEMLAEGVIQNASLLTGTGFSKIQLNRRFGTGAIPHLHFGDLTRVDRGTFNFSLGSTPTIDGKLTFTSGISSALVGEGSNAFNTPIVPFALSNSSLATYDPVTGIRPLNSSLEAVRDFRPGANVNWNSDLGPVDVDVTINSLMLNWALRGTGTVTVSSGVVIGNGEILTPLAFGNAEGFLYGNGLQIRGPISGSNGLTVTSLSMSSPTELSGANTFTGPLTINAGVLRYASLASLGADSSEIIINDAKLDYLGTEALTFNRPIRTTGYLTGIKSSGGPLTVAGTISGTAGILIEGDVTLTGTNTHQGLTVIGGKLTIGSDSALGSGPLLIGSEEGAMISSLVLTQPWSTTRPVEIGGRSSGEQVIDTGTFDATLHGPLISFGSGVHGRSTLVKKGTGTLKITDSNAFLGNLTVEAGTVEIGGQLLNTGTVTVGIEGKLSGSVNIDRNVFVSGTLAPGKMSTRNLYFSDGATLALELLSVNAFDQLTVTDTFTLNGLVNLVLSLGFDPIDHVDSFLVLSKEANGPISGSGMARFGFGGNPLEEGENFAVGDQQFRISYLGGTGNDVVLYAVPEPGSASLIVAGFAALGLGRFRRTRRGRETN